MNDRERNGFELVYDFQIDDGQLGDASPTVSFVLGVECGALIAKTTHETEGLLWMHEANRERAEDILRRGVRSWDIRTRHDDWFTVQWWTP